MARRFFFFFFERMARRHKTTKLTEKLLFNKRVGKQGKYLVRRLIKL